MGGIARPLKLANASEGVEQFYVRRRRLVEINKCDLVRQYRFKLFDMLCNYPACVTKAYGIDFFAARLELLAPI